MIPNKTSKGDQINDINCGSIHYHGKNAIRQETEKDTR